MKPRSLSIIFAGGGTGGHLNPGIAIAQEVMNRNADSRIRFVGTDRPLEVDLLAKAGFEHRAITVEGLMGKGTGRQLASLLKLPLGIAQSLLMVREFRPDLVFGIGGYAAGPAVLGAWLLGCKTVLHEQNVAPGFTNRLLGAIVRRIYVSFRETAHYFNEKKTVVTGNPVRRNIVTSASEDMGRGRKARFTVLITGGSQGAHHINQAVVDGIGHLKAKTAYCFIHLTGPDDVHEVKRAYRRHGICSDVCSYSDDMHRLLRIADLIVCRAGATTVAEITTVGKAAIFIPMPHKDGHQAMNARALARAGGADVILQEDLEGRMLMEKIEHYVSHPGALKQMADNARKMGRADAALSIVDDCYRLVGSTSAGLPQPDSASTG